jgi:hypothetical protein
MVALFSGWSLVVLVEAPSACECGSTEDSAIHVDNQHYDAHSGSSDYSSKERPTRD